MKNKTTPSKKKTDSKTIRIVHPKYEDSDKQYIPLRHAIIAVEYDGQKVLDYIDWLRGRSIEEGMATSVQFRTRARTICKQFGLEIPEWATIRKARQKLTPEERAKRQRLRARNYYHNVVKALMQKGREALAKEKAHAAP